MNMSNRRTEDHRFGCKDRKREEPAYTTMLRPDMSASLPSLLFHLLSFIIYLLLFLAKTKYKRGLSLQRSTAPMPLGQTEGIVHSVKLDGVALSVTLYLTAKHKEGTT